MMNKAEKLMKSVDLEVQLNKVVERMEEHMFLNEVFMEKVDREYKDRRRDMQLLKDVRKRMGNLLVIITDIKDIEQQAIAINDMDLYWKCSGKEAKAMSQMELLRSKYDL